MTMHKFYNFLLPRKDLYFLMGAFLVSIIIEAVFNDPMCSLISIQEDHERQKFVMLILQVRGHADDEMDDHDDNAQTEFSQKKKIKSSERYGCQVATGSDLCHSLVTLYAL